MHNVDILYIHIYFYDFKLYTVLKKSWFSASNAEQTKPFENLRIITPPFFLHLTSYYNPTSANTNMDSLEFPLFICLLTYQTICFYSF